MAEERQKRQIAFSVSVEDILTGEFVKMEGWDPNYIKTPFGLKISRVTIMGTVLNNTNSQIELDDTTGIITIRSFEHFDPFDELKTGDFVLLIARVREFSNEIYLSPETCKTINPAYMQMHKTNISIVKKFFNENIIKQKEKEILVDLSEKEIISVDKIKINPSEKVLKYIDENDQGNGVHRQEIISHFEDIEIGIIFDKLINDGSIFEITSDVFRVLK